MSTAKVFWSGNSQAIRLPKDFRFPPGTEEVEIRREGERIVLEPVHVKPGRNPFGEPSKVCLRISTGRPKCAQPHHVPEEH